MNIEIADMAKRVYMFLLWEIC